MNNLMKAELYKLLRNKAVIVCTCLMVGFNLLQLFSTLMMMLVSNQIGIIGSGYLGKNSLPMVFLNMGPTVIMFAIMIASFVSSEYKNGTIKFYFTSGYTRSQVYFTKFKIIAILTAIYCLSSLLFIGVPNMLMFGWGAEVIASDVISYISRFILMSIYIFATNLLFYAIAIKSRSTVAVIAVSIVLPVVTTMLMPLVIIMGGTNFELVLRVTIYSMQVFLPNDITLQMVGNLAVPFKELIFSMIVCVATLVFSILLALRCFNRQDIK